MTYTSIVFFIYKFQQCWPNRSKATPESTERKTKRAKHSAHKSHDGAETWIRIIWILMEH